MRSRIWSTLELFNPGAQAVDLSAWKLTKGIEHQFAPGTRIAAGGYLVLARDADRFKEFYGFAPSATFKGSLSHKAMRIDLLDARGKKADSIKYKDEAPWPTAADGYSASLERICPTANGTLPENWAASPLPDEMKPAGTPGTQNASYSATLPPVISNIQFSPANPTPAQSVRIEAEVRGIGVREVNLKYRLASSGLEQAEVTIPMTNTDERHFTASIPAQKADQLIRFRVQAVNEKGAQRFFPAETEPRPALSCFVHEKFEPGKVPLALVIDVDGEERKTLEKHLHSANERGFGEEDQMRMFARMQLESGLDVAPLWFELASSQQLRFEQLSQLRSVFTNQLATREKLISETVDSGDIKEKIKTIPQVVKSFHADVGTALKPVLDAGQEKEVDAIQQKQVQAAAGGPQRFTPDMLLKRFLNLEAGFFKLSTRADVDEAQFKQIAEVYRAALAERATLAPAAQALMQGQGDFEDLREKMDKVSQTVAGKLKPILTATQARDFERAQNDAASFMPGRGRAKPPHRPQGRAAFVFVNAQTGEPELFDFVNVTERNSGLNVHFHRDRMFHGMSTVNVLYESNDRFVLAEPIAYELYRRAGNAAPIAEYMRLTMDGQPLGYYEFIEQPNRSFLQRNHLRGDGNLYKILWYESGVVGQHQKKTNRQTGHDDIVALVDLLEKTKNDPDAQWAIIKKNFNVEQVVNYFAANMCLSHWDGFFNNYFTYHDPSSGKWEMYPWDQDKTWGFYDGIDENQVFYDMPLTFGMEGDRPPGWPKDRPVPRGFGMGSSWWRPGGYFSKPLLANPHFRKQFLARIKEMVETIYTPEIFFPLLDDLQARLKEEVRFRATIIKQDPDAAEAALQRNIQSLKEHLTKRRQFLLEQEEIRTAGKVAKAELQSK